MPLNRLRLGFKVGLRRIDRGKNPLGVGREQSPRVRKPDTSAHFLEQQQASLPLQSSELLGNGRWREPEFLRNSAHRPPRLKLMEKPKSAKLDHVAMLTYPMKKKSLLYTICRGQNVLSVTVAPSTRSLQDLTQWPRTRLACLPTPLHPLRRLSSELGGPELWIKRDDLSGLAGGGNKTRKLEFLVADALQFGSTVLVTVGAIQSNHTRQTAAAAARVGLDCVLLHNNWVPATGSSYRRVGNVLLSDLLGAHLYYDPAERAVGDEGKLGALAEHLRTEGHVPYVIPCGASDHRLGGFGYVACAAEIALQAQDLGLEFDYVVHCTGSSSTQAGLLAGFAALTSHTRVIGVADDDEITDKVERVLRLANATLAELGFAATLSRSDVTVVSADPSPYGVAASKTIDAMRFLARTEGIVVDPVYEGRSMLGLIELIRDGVLRSGDRVLFLHMGGTPAVHGYDEQIWEKSLDLLTTHSGPE
jgi:1-aminocyclopropane-1-carboxylate deaminase